MSSLAELLERGAVLAEACHAAANGVLVPNIDSVVGELHDINAALEAELGSVDYHAVPQRRGGQVPQFFGGV